MPNPAVDALMTTQARRERERIEIGFVKSGCRCSNDHSSIRDLSGTLAETKRTCRIVSDVGTLPSASVTDSFFYLIYNARSDWLSTKNRSGMGCDQKGESGNKLLPAYRTRSDHKEEIHASKKG